MTYEQFLERKRIIDIPSGLNDIPELNNMMFDFQSDIVKWALKRGRACIFADCGMGKSIMELEIAKHIDGDCIIFAPLAVTNQTLREADKFGGYDIQYSGDGVKRSKITITNYERMEKFNPKDFNGIILDESSILKSFTGKYRTELIKNWNLSYRFACSATPAPNDFMELGNHAEFIGAMTRTEMLSMFFVHDGGDTAKWRLKGHAESEFWKWICSWAVMIRKPSDLGYDDGKFILPELKIEQVTVKSKDVLDGFLFPIEAQTLSERQAARRNTISDRVSAAVELVKTRPHEQWLIWCDLNDESAELTKSIQGAVEVKGADNDEHKINAMIGFQKGTVQILVSKPKIAGMGMNFQSCRNMIFVGLSDSYEMFYQAVRRCWRFGQNNNVNAFVVTAETEGAVVKNILRKEEQAEMMAEMMVEHMKDINTSDIHGLKRDVAEYNANVKMIVPSWVA